MQFRHTYANLLKSLDKHEGFRDFSGAKIRHSADLETIPSSGSEKSRISSNYKTKMKD